MAEAVYGHSKPKSGMAMAIVAIPVAPPLHHPMARRSDKFEGGLTSLMF